MELTFEGVSFSISADEHVELEVGGRVVWRAEPGAPAGPVVCRLHQLLETDVLMQLDSQEERHLQQDTLQLADACNDGEWCYRPADSDIGHGIGSRRCTGLIRRISEIIMAIF